MRLTLRIFAVVEPNKEVRRFVTFIVDPVVVKAPTDEFGASDLDLDSRRVT